MESIREKYIKDWNFACDHSNNSLEKAREIFFYINPYIPSEHFEFTYELVFPEKIMD